MNLTHPKVPGSSVEVDSDHLTPYLTQGWVQVQDEKPADKPGDE